MSTRGMGYAWHDMGDGVAVLELDGVDAVELAVYADDEGLIAALWVDSETGSVLGQARGGAT